MSNFRLINADKLFEEVGQIKPRNKEHYKAIGEFMNMITDSETINISPEVEVFCDFRECIYNQNGVCTKEVIDLDERVEDIFVGCPDAEWKGDADNE